MSIFSQLVTLNFVGPPVVLIGHLLGILQGYPSSNCIVCEVVLASQGTNAALGKDYFFQFIAVPPFSRSCGASNKKHPRSP